MGTERDAQSIWMDIGQASFSQRFIDADGVRTRLLTAGDPEKPLLLLLHGTGGHAEAYMRNLGAHSKFFYTVAVDSIGHGWTDPSPAGYEIADYAKHVLDVMAALGRDKAHVSGESLGGWVAAHLAVHHPDKVDRIVLNTAGGWTAHPEVMQRIKTLSTAATENPSWEAIRGRLEFLMYDKSTVSDDLIAVRQAIYSQSGYAQVMQGILCLQDMPIRRRNMISEEQYRSIKAPTLVVWTSHDPTASPEEGRQISEMIPNATYVVLNECGHWPQYEDAEAFNQLHIDFFNNH